MSTESDTAIIEKVKIKEPSKYKVIIHDNPITSYEEVIFILSRCFEKNEEEAFQIANKVNTSGKGICGTYTKEIAEAKLSLVGMAKQYLIQMVPYRAQAINELKFTLEKE